MNLEERIVDYIQNNPIEHDGKTLTIEDLVIKLPDSSIDNQLVLKLKGEGSLEGVIRGKVVVKDSLSKALISKGNLMNIMKFPVKTERGTYIINGTEKNVLNQMRLKPGCYSTRDTTSNKIKTNITFSRPKNKMYMPQLSLTLKISSSPQFTVGIKKGSKETNFNVLNFLWILGFTDQETEEILGKGHIASSLIEKYAKKVQAHSPRKFLGVLVGNESSVANLTDDQARQQIWNFINGSAKFDEEAVQSTVGVKTSTLDKEVVKNAIAKTIALAQNSEQQDDNKDDLKFKIIDSDDDLMFEQFLKSYDSFITTASNSLLSNKSINAKTFLGVTKLGDGIKDFLSKSSLVQTPEEINPLFLDTMNRKITQMGDGGLSKDSSRKEVNARNITMSSINKIDPVETPESLNIGLVQHLTSGVEVENGTLKIKVFKVNNGVAKKENPIKLSSIEEEEKVIAYYDTRYMEDNKGKITFTKPQIPCRFKGDTKEFPIKEIQYVDTSPTNLLGTATNMIPFVMHDDGNRAMMGAKMLTQATSIKNKEVPLVATLADKDSGLTFEQQIGSKFGKPILSTVHGVVEAIENSKIIIRDKNNKTHEYNYYRYYPLTQSYMNNELKVKVGDIVDPGSMLAEGWQTKDGSLALGKNTRVGYLSYKGFNYEDGVVISKSYAKAMASEDVNTYEIEIPVGAIGGVGSGVREELMKYTTDAAILKLNKDGIIQEGEYIKAGNIIAAILVPLEGNSTLLDQIMNDGKPAEGWKLRPIAVDSNSYVGGKIVRKTIIDNPTSFLKQKIVLTLLKNEELKVGDKVAGRHGNKGTITKILDDKLMPVAEDGKPFELLFSPLAIPSRKNTGQIFEVNAGLIAEKTGKQFKVENFNFDEKNKVLKELEALGYKGGKMKVTLKEEDEKGNIINIKGENPVTTGNMYIMKLKHKVDDKIQSRSNYEGPGISSREKMPTKTVGAAAGEKHNPQSIGEMEMRALQGHNAVWNILESTTIKADGGGGRDERIALFRALATGKIEGEDLHNKSTTPETVKIMSDKLKALGLNLKPYYKGKVAGSLSQPFDAVGIAPLDPKEFLKSIGPQHEITKHTDFLNARSLYNDTGKKDSEKVYISGGLMDPDIFGDMSEEESRSKWGYIKLATPIPNPVLLQDSSYNPYSVLTGIKRTDLVDMVTGKSIVIGNEVDMDNSLKDMPEELKLEYKQEMLKNMQELGYTPGDIIKVSDYEKNVSSKGLIIPTRAGSDFLRDKLSTIDVNTALADAQSELENAKSSGVDSAYKKVRVLRNLSNNKIKPVDLLMTYIPVMPLYLRPITINKEENKVESDDINKIYSKIIHANNTLKEGVLDGEGHIDFMKSGKDAVDAAKGVAAVYKSIAGLSGKIEAKDIKTGKTLIDVGLGGRNGLVRGKMLSKRVDFSGRSVIGVDPNLKLDEAGLPLDIAKNVYKPFAIKELVSRGYAPTEQEARKMLKGDSPEIKKVIQDIAIDRPILLNRQPSLHKYSIQALTPIIKDKEDGNVVRSIQLNPLVVTGYNADFDGDTMAVHVPVTEKAKEEAKKLMMPSQNLINPTDGKMIIELRHEMLLGLYQMTSGWNKPIGTPKIYNDINQLRNDYFMGKVHSRQRVKVPICPHETTAGIALFNWCIPDRVKTIPSVKGGTTGRNFKKGWGKKEVSELFASIYAESEKTNFELLSKTQISLLLDRFKDLGFKASTIGSVSLGADDFVEVKSISNKIEDAAQKGATIENWTKLQNEIEKQIQGGILQDDNPLQIMMQSGARANPGQIRRMLFTQGVGMDVAKNLREPIKESLFDGLSTKDYFLMGADARKGMYDRAVSTSEPGALSRKVWSAVQDVVIKDTDCHTKGYTVMKKSDAPSVKGRVAGADIIGTDGKIICKRNDMITNDVYSKIFADNSIQFVPIRSPLRCKTVGGVCQKCYGAMPGTNKLVDVGSSIGILASQALGEPVTQMTMNTFHTGGTNSAATLGLPRVQNILQLGKDKQYGAVISNTTGIVKEIKDTDNSINITIEKTVYKIPKDLTGKTPKIKVKIGDSVKAGDFLTVGDSNDILMYNGDSGVNITLTNADPKALFKAKSLSVGKEEALKETQDYLTNTMQHAFEASNSSFDRRHMETIISKLTQNAKVLNPGDSNLLRGQEIDVSYIKKWNEEHSSPLLAKVVDVQNAKDILNTVVAENVKDKTGKILIKKGTLITMDMIPTLSINVQNPKIKVMPRLIEYDYSLKGMNNVSEAGHDNWLSNMGGENVYRNIARGAAFGQVDRLNDPRSRLMTGKLLNIGEGSKIPDEAKQEIGSSMVNFLNNHADKIIKKHGIKK